MVILGGVSIAGGAGTIGGVMLTMGAITYGLALANIPGIYMTIVVGVLLLATIALSRLLVLDIGKTSVKLALVAASGQRPAAAPLWKRAARTPS